MNTLQKTTTGSLFNHTGILTAAGDYAGKFSQEANDILMDGDEFMYGPDGWSDIMINERTGKMYAVLAKGELTCQNAEVFYSEIEESQCCKAFAEAKEKIDRY